MGVYYMWVNATKGQYLGDDPFETGLKLIDQTWASNPMTDAVLTLLASDWAGDLVALVGDNFSFSEDEGYLIKIEGLNRPGVVAFCESTKDGPYEYAMG